MARISIVSKSGHTEFDFWCPDSGGYVRLESENRSGTLGTQICEGGGTRGSTLSANAETLEKVAKKWLKQKRHFVGGGARQWGQ